MEQEEPRSLHVGSTARGASLALQSLPMEHRPKKTRMQS